MATRLDDDGGIDGEALAFPPHASSFDVSNFDIVNSDCGGDEDTALEGDYDSITTEEEDGLPHEDDDATVIAGNDAALAARTSRIISSYRCYLSEIETVAAENQRLMNEMVSLRGSLGMLEATRAPPAPRLDHQYELDVREMEIEEETSSNRYSQPLMHSGQIKRRFVGAMICAVAMGSMAIFSFYSAATHSREQKNATDWDKGLDSTLQAEAEEVSMQQAAAMQYPAANAKAEFLSSQTQQASPSPDRIKSEMEHISIAKMISAQPLQSKKEIDNPAMAMIQDLIAHPEDVVLVSSAQGGTNNRDYAPEKGVQTNALSAVELLATRDSVSTQHSTSEKFAKNSKNGKYKSGKGGKLVTSYHPTSKSGKGDSNAFQAKAKTKSVSANSQLSDNSKTAKKNSSAKANMSSPVTSLQEAPITRDASLHLEAAGILYQAISSQYNPKFYDRSRGWEGTTFTDAAYFCSTAYPKDEHGRPGVPCPYSAYCPEGPNSIPFGGYQSGTSYAPVIEATEHWLGWVQLSPVHSCVAFNYLKPEPSAEQTKSIMCCRDYSR